jgi:hypothetical protein
VIHDGLDARDLIGGGAKLWVCFARGLEILLEDRVETVVDCIDVLREGDARFVAERDRIPGLHPRDVGTGERSQGAPLFDVHRAMRLHGRRRRAEVMRHGRRWRFAAACKERHRGGDRCKAKQRRTKVSPQPLAGHWAKAWSSVS